MADEAHKLDVALRAKVGIIWIQSSEEKRVERQVTNLVSEEGKGYEVEAWSPTQGLIPIEKVDDGREDEQTKDAVEAVKTLIQKPGRICALFRGAADWLKDPLTLRSFKDAHRRLPHLPKESAKQIIIIDGKTPPENLTGVTVIDWSLPDRETIEKIVDSCLDWVPEKAQKDIQENGNKDRVVDAAVGLTSDDISMALSRSVAEHEKFVPSVISAEKERVVKGTGLEWHNPDPRGLEGVGGLDALKAWLFTRQKAFSKAARDYGIPMPKGILLTGVQGCGKSLTASCLATAWKLPLLQLDVGSLFSKYVGESEGKLRRALQTAEAIAPCVLMLDEVNFGLVTWLYAGTSEHFSILGLTIPHKEN